MAVSINSQSIRPLSFWIVKQTDAIKASIKNSYKSTRTSDAYHMRLASVICRPDGCASSVVDDVIGWVERALVAMTDSRYNFVMNQILGSALVTCNPPLNTVKGWKEVTANPPAVVVSNTDGEFTIAVGGPIAINTVIGTLSWANYDAVVTNLVNMQTIPAIRTNLSITTSNALAAGDFVSMQSYLMPMGCSSESEYLLYKGKALAIAHLNWNTSTLEFNLRIALFLHALPIRDTSTISWIYAALSGLLTVHASLKLGIRLT